MEGFNVNPKRLILIDLVRKTWCHQASRSDHFGVSDCSLKGQGSHHGGEPTAMLEAEARGGPWAPRLRWFIRERRETETGGGPTEEATEKDNGFVLA